MIFAGFLGDQIALRCMLPHPLPEVSDSRNEFVLKRILESCFCSDSGQNAEEMNDLDPALAGNRLDYLEFIISQNSIIILTFAPEYVIVKVSKTIPLRLKGGPENV